jgi:hypothetical protein
MYLCKENNDEISLFFILAPLKTIPATKDFTGTRQAIVSSYSLSVHVATRISTLFYIKRIYLAGCLTTAEYLKQKLPSSKAAKSLGINGRLA